MFNLRSFLIAMFHSKWTMSVYGQGKNATNIVNGNRNMHQWCLIVICFIQTQIYIISKCLSYIVKFETFVNSPIYVLLAKGRVNHQRNCKFQL